VAKSNLVRLMVRPDMLLAVLGIVTGVVGAISAGQLMQARVRAAESALNARYRPREVVVAARDVAAGQVVEAQMLALRRMPRDFVPAGALTGSQAGSLIGGRLVVGLRRGDPVQTSIVGSRDNQALSSLVRAGGRAMTISVDDTNSMAGLLAAGDVVDLYYSRSQGDGTVLSPLLERVEVLAAGEDLAHDPTEPRRPEDVGHAFSTLTILVSPEDAARVVLAQGTGTLTVLLRSQADEGPAAVATRNSRMLLAQRRPSPSTNESPADTIELIVGGSGTVVPEVSRLNIGTAGSLRSGGRT
jgi:pilus assembly protein CpaB